MLDPEQLSEFRVRLDPDDLYEARHRKIFAVMCELDSAGSPIDLRTLQAILEQRDQLEAVGGLPYLSQLVDFLPDLSALDSYVEIILERSGRRRLVDALTGAVQAIDQGKELSDVTGPLSATIEELNSRVHPGETRRVWPLSELLADPEAIKLPEPTIPKLAWPGRATLFASREKLGKSTFATDAAAAVSAGRSFLAKPTERGIVLWATEEHVGDVARRMRDFHADPDTVVVMQWGVNPVAEIRAEAERLQPALLVIDTLAAFSEHAKPKSGESSDWAAIMRPLVRIAREIGCALLILHHANRRDTYRDSTEIGAAVDVICEMSGARTGTIRRIAYQGRYGRGSFSVRKLGHQFELVDEHDSSGLEVAVLEFIEDNSGCTQGKVRKGVKGSTEDIRTAISDLLDCGRIVNQGTSTAHHYHLSEPIPEQSTLGTGFEAEPNRAVPPVPSCGDKEIPGSVQQAGAHSVPRSPTKGRDRDRCAGTAPAETTEEGNSE